LVLFRTVGFGAGPGKQTRSCQVQTNKKCFLPYYRNQSLSDCLEHLTFQISKQSLQFSSPNFFLIFSRITFPDILLLCFQKSLLLSLSYPRSPSEGPFQDSKVLFFGSQRAIRPAGLPTRPSEEYKKLAKNGGCGLHVDAEDPIYNSGLLMYYSCFVEPDVEDCDRDHPLPQNDLVCFQHQNGGRGARIQTMHPNFLCLAFHQSWKCHGTVFQENDVFQEGIHGFRVVTYPIKAVEDLVEHCQDEAPFQSVLQQWKTALLNSSSPKKLQCGLDRIFNKTLE